MSVLGLNIKQFYLTIDRTLSGATTPGQSGSGSDDNEGVLCSPKSSSITGALGNAEYACLVLYPGHSLVLLLCRDAFDEFFNPTRMG